MVGNFNGGGSVAVTARIIDEMSGPNTCREFPNAVPKKKLTSDKFRTVSTTAVSHIDSEIFKSVIVEMTQYQFRDTNDLESPKESWDRVLIPILKIPKRCGDRLEIVPKCIPTTIAHLKIYSVRYVVLMPP